jgi:hypothetical protein
VQAFFDQWGPLVYIGVALLVAVIIARALRGRSTPTPPATANESKPAIEQNPLAKPMENQMPTWKGLLIAGGIVAVVLFVVYIGGGF